MSYLEISKPNLRNNLKQLFAMKNLILILALAVSSLVSAQFTGCKSAFTVSPNDYSLHSYSLSVLLPNGREVMINDDMSGSVFTIAGNPGEGRIHTLVMSDFSGNVQDTYIIKSESVDGTCLSLFTANNLVGKNSKLFIHNEEDIVGY